MILATLGKLSVAQALTAGATALTNQISESAILGSGPTDLWWVLDTNVIPGASGSSSTYTFSLRVATSTALTTFKEVLSFLITGALDKRLLTAGKHLMVVNLGKILPQLIREFRAEQTLTDASLVYIGVMATLADGNGTAAISVDCALSPTEPQSEHFEMKTVSPVGVPTIASAGSGS